MVTTYSVIQAIMKKKFTNMIGTVYRSVDGQVNIVGLAQTHMGIFLT